LIRAEIMLAIFSIGKVCSFIFKEEELQQVVVWRGGMKIRKWITEFLVTLACLYLNRNGKMVEAQ
jgi:hypothetical protein